MAQANNVDSQVRQSDCVRSQYDTARLRPSSSDKEWTRAMASESSLLRKSCYDTNNNTTGQCVHLGNNGERDGELDENVENEIVPAIQIYKTFSLATFGNDMRFSGDRCDLVDTSTDGICLQDKYMLTNLDHSGTDKSDRTAIEQGNLLTSGSGSCKENWKEEKQEQKSPASSYEDADDHVDRHIINLECFLNTCTTPTTPKEKTTSRAQMKNGKLDMDENFPSFSLPESRTTSAEQYNFLLPTTESAFYDDHAYFYTETRPTSQDRQSTMVRRETKPQLQALATSVNNTRSENNEMGSLILPNENDDCYSEYSHPFELETFGSCGDADVASHLVVDLNERVSFDSGVFDLSLPTGHLRADSLKEHSRNVHNIYDVKPTNRNIKSEIFERSKDHIFSTYDSQAARGMLYSREYPASTEPSFYKVGANRDQMCNREVIKTMEDPYMSADYDYRYRPYDEEKAYPASCHVNGPCSGWEPWVTNAGFHGTATTGMAGESGRGVFSSDRHSPSLFEGYPAPSDCVDCLHMSSLRDGEETDDADETGPMSEMVSLSSSSHAGVAASDCMSGYALDAASPALTKFNPATLTPPPSASSTPVPPGNHDHGHAADDAPFIYPYASFPGHLPSSTPAAAGESVMMLAQSRQQLTGQGVPDQLTPDLLSHGLHRATKRPFPSMADAVRSAGSRPSPFSRSPVRKQHPPPPTCPDGSSSNQAGGATTATISTSRAGGHHQASKRRGNGKSRKIQIQSDTISTSSTTKSSKGAASTTAASARPEYVDRSDELAAAVDQGYGRGSGHTRATRGSSSGGSGGAERGPRHNEPLRQEAVDVMTRWYEEHIDNPYPTKAQKAVMALEGQISENQVKSWFANKRNRTHNTKPKVQKRAMEEKLKELFKDLKNTNTAWPADNHHLIQQLSGIIQHCNMKME